MRTIRKYKLILNKDIYMPDGAVILKLMQTGFINQPLSILVEIDDEAPPIPRRFDIFSNRASLPNDAKYVDSYLANEHTWHVYEVGV